MTVMWRLVRGPTRHGNVQVLSTYVLQRHKADTAVPPTGASQTSLSTAKLTRDQFSGVKKQPSKVSTSKMIAGQDFKPYFEMLNKRRLEARRSILVEIETPGDSGGLKHICDKVAPNSCFFYKASGKNFVLVEFKDEAGLRKALKETYHSKDPQIIPVISPFLFFHHLSGSNSKRWLPDRTQELQCNEGNILQELETLKSGSNDRLRTEMLHLYEKSRISDLSLRLRFFTCHQLDLALEGLTSYARALPFGSSVSGFGRNTGDLDIYLHFSKNLSSEKMGSKSQLFFHSKTCMQNKKLLLKLIGDTISVFLPGCSDVISILSARVPIVKYHQSFTNLECDLNNSAPSGYDLSHIMYLMNHWDTRVAPLVYAIRLWASQNNVSSLKKPSPALANFSLVLMVLFYLQKKQILPSLESFNSLPEDMVTPGLDPNLATVFPDLRKVRNGVLSGKNSEGIDSLLFGFFDFYSNFDFNKNKISIFHGITVTKVSRSPLDIENPVYPNLNVSQNVALSNLKLFVREASKACSQLDAKTYSSKSISVILHKSKPTEKGVPYNEARPQALH